MLLRCLKIHPLQLVGITSNIIFRKWLKGNENWLHNFSELYNNQAYEFSRKFVGKNAPFKGIFRRIHYNYNGHFR